MRISEANGHKKAQMIGVAAELERPGTICPSVSLFSLQRVMIHFKDGNAIHHEENFRSLLIQ